MRVKAVLYTQHKSRDATYPLVIHVFHKKRLLHPVGYKIRESQWDAENAVVVRHPDRHTINHTITELLSQARSYISHCKMHGLPLNIHKIFTEVAEEDFTSFLQKEAGFYQSRGQASRAHSLSQIVAKIKKWKGSLLFSELDRTCCHCLDSYLKTRGNSATTRRDNFLFLSLCYKRWLKQTNTVGINPFEDYLQESRIKKDPVHKIRLSREEVGKLETLELKGPRALYRDMWLFSYYARGIRFENVLTIKKEAVQGSVLLIKAVKGGKLAQVPLHDKLRAIINKYKYVGGEFIFPVIESVPGDAMAFLQLKQKKSVLINGLLKKIALQAGIPPLSFHTSRHSFAQNLKDAGVDVSTISELLLHSDVKTTEGYLNSLEENTVGKEIIDKLYNNK